MSNNIRRLNKKGLLLVISGPSGSGKTTLADQIISQKSLSKKITKAVSFTTRPKRSGEKHKKDYFFISPCEFKQNRLKKKILEWTKYLGYYYGTPKEFVDKKLKAGKSVILCVDLKGAEYLKRIYPGQTITIFILPPTLRELRQRIEKRCHKIKTREVSRRLGLAKKEMLSAKDFDYSILNNDLGKAAKQLKKIILKETKNR